MQSCQACEERRSDRVKRVTARALAHGEADPQLVSARLEVDFLDSVIAVRLAEKEVREHEARGIQLELEQAERDQALAEFAVTAAKSQAVDPIVLDAIGSELDSRQDRHEGMLETAQVARERLSPNTERIAELDAAYQSLKAEFPGGIPQERMRDLADEARDLATETREIADEEIPQIDAWSEEPIGHDEQDSSAP